MKRFKPHITFFIHIYEFHKNGDFTKNGTVERKWTTEKGTIKVVNPTMGSWFGMFSEEASYSVTPTELVIHKADQFFPMSPGTYVRP